MFFEYAITRNLFYNMKNLTLSFSLVALFFLIIGCNNDNNENNDTENNSTESLLIEGEEPEVIAGPFEFTEGPYWHPDGYLLFSDIPANRVYRWSEDMEQPEVFIDSSGNSNGIQADVDGNILLAQHQGSISKVNDDGQLEVLADSYEGSRLNSPNDIAVHSNGNIFFTDPPFGVDDEDRELEFSGVYKLTPEGELTLVHDELEYPNGIVFSPDESVLYVSESGSGDITVFEVDENGDPHSPQQFANIGSMGEMGGADGMVADQQGNLYTTGPNGLTIFDSEGNELHQLTFDEQITNLEWGGDESNQLFITGSDHVYRFPINTTGNKKR